MRDGDGHPAGPGLPGTEAASQPLLREQVCGRQVRQVAGAQGAGLPLTPRTGGWVPGSCRSSPGHLHVTEPCLLMPVPACPSPGPSPACWKYGWIIMGKTFVSSQNFLPYETSAIAKTAHARHRCASPGPALPEAIQTPPGSSFSVDNQCMSFWSISACRGEETLFVCFF